MASPDSSDQPKPDTPTSAGASIVTDPDPPSKAAISQNFPKSSKNPRVRAAVLVAEDALSDAEIAGKVGITRRSLTNWKRDPAFRERVEELVAQFAEQAASHAIANLDHRIQRYQTRADALDSIVVERAADPSMQEVPGGRSGYLLRQLKSITVTYEPEPNDDGEIERGATATMVRQQLAEYAVDTGLLKELRELDKQAAIESGQWAEKREITGASGAPLTIQIIERSDGPQ